MEQPTQWSWWWGLGRDRAGPRRAGLSQLACCCIPHLHKPLIRAARHLAHLATEGEKKTRTGRVSRGSRRSQIRATCWQISQHLRPAPVCKILRRKQDQGPSLLACETSVKKSMMRLKDHFVTLIFLLRRQISYSTSFFLFFFFCKNGIHEPIQNANGTYGYGVSYTVTPSMDTLATELA